MIKIILITIIVSALIVAHDGDPVNALKYTVCGKFDQNLVLSNNHLKRKTLDEFEKP